MGFSNTDNLQRCASYEDAVRIFRSLPFKEPTRGGARVWQYGERPLGTKQQHHYRVEKEPSGGYAVWLYHTMMAQYCAPEPDGSRRVVYTWDRRITSTSFMHNVCRVCHVMHYDTTDGRKVAVPLENDSASLWFDAQGRLDVARSDHAPTVKYLSSDDDKRRRAEFKKQYRIYAQMMALRHADAQDDIRKTDYWGMRMYRPFTSPKVPWKAISEVQGWLKGYHEHNDADIEALSVAAGVLVRFTKGRAAYSGKPAPTHTQLENAILRWMLETADLDHLSLRVEEPKFKEVKEK